MSVGNRRHDHRRAVLAIVANEGFLSMRGRFRRTNRPPPFEHLQQFRRGRPLGETEVLDLTPSESDETLWPGDVLSAAEDLPCGTVETNPLCFETRDVVNGVNPADSERHPEDQRVRYVLRCGGAHVAISSSYSGKVGGILYTRITVHRVLLSAQCFFEALLSIIVIKRKPASFEAGFLFHHPVYRIS